jgi:choline dehydrogenase
VDYDILIVGGGSAGCVLANRLSADPDREVLLVEAGPDFESEADLPEDVRLAAYAPQSHSWDYVSEPDRYGNAVPVPRGKIIGGSSSINYCFAMRARPSDHDAWVAAGNPGWSYSEVLPYYRAMESYAHGDARWHGRDGEYRISPGDWSSLAEAAAASKEAALALGYGLVDDVNAPGEPGFGLAPLSAWDGVRQSTAITYLNPSRHRPNLTVRGDTLVDRAIFDESASRATGVLLASGETVTAKTVILSAGAYNTPTLLMRSGIGDREELDAHGINVLAEAPGVGKNLMEHPAMWTVFAAKEPRGEMPTMYQVALSARSGAGVQDYNLHVCPSAVVTTEMLPPNFVPPSHAHPTGWDMVFFVACVNPFSRGSVRLGGPGPADAPVIDLGLYSDPRDAEVVAEGVRIARRLAVTEPLSDLLVTERLPGAGVADSDLAEAVMRAPSNYNHGCGTARMGPDEDVMAVVDASCRVKGVRDLFVVDASVMPSIPRVTINVTTIALAEKFAAELRKTL